MQDFVHPEWGNTPELVGQLSCNLQRFEVDSTRLEQSGRFPGLDPQLAQSAACRLQSARAHQRRRTGPASSASSGKPPDSKSQAELQANPRSICTSLIISPPPFQGGIAWQHCGQTSHASRRHASRISGRPQRKPTPVGPYILWPFDRFDACGISRRAKLPSGWRLRGSPPPGQPHPRDTNPSGTLQEAEHEERVGQI